MNYSDVEKWNEMLATLRKIAKGGMTHEQVRLLTKRVARGVTKQEYSGPNFRQW